LKGLKEKILPELNDEFAKEFGGHDHLADLRKKVGEDLETYLKRASRVKAERELLDKLVEKNPLEVPKGLVKRHAEEMAKQNLNRMGIKEATKEDIGHFTEQFMTRAEKEIKAGFLLEAIISSEKVELSGEDEAKKLKELSEQYKIDESKLKDQLGEETIKHFRAQWLEDKALDFLFSQSKIKDKKVSADEAHSHAHHDHEGHEHEGEEGKA
jgi:trigger factor